MFMMSKGPSTMDADMSVKSSQSRPKELYESRSPGLKDWTLCLAV